MDSYTLVLDIVIILIFARIFGEVANFLKAPVVIGELVAGIILGPSLLGWIIDPSQLQLTAQMGIILLLFEVGLETDVDKLAMSGKNAAIVAISGVILPFIGGFWVSYHLFDLSYIASLFIGSTLTATSIGITLRILKDFKKQNSSEAQVIIGAAVFDDIIGIIILSVLYEFASIGTVDLINSLKVFLYICFFFALAPFAAKCMSHTIKKWDEKSSIPGLIPTTIVSLILFFAWLAHKFGAPGLLGGFTAGLALSRQFFFPFAAFMNDSQKFNNYVEKQMKPIISLFTPIFFVTIGLSLDLRAIEWSSSYIWILTSSLLIISIIGKILSGFMLFKQSLYSRFVIGMCMVPRGEVGLIFANIGLISKAFSNDIYASLILVIGLTTLIIPFVLRLLFESSWSRKKTF